MALDPRQGVDVHRTVSRTGPFLNIGNAPVQETPAEDDDHIILGRE